MQKKWMVLLAALALLFVAGCGKTGEEHLTADGKNAEVEGGQAGEGLSGKTAGASEEEQQRVEEPVHSEPTAGQEDAQGEFQFSDLSDRVFYFSSGAGAWFTELHIRDTGSFDGHYQDADMGDSGDGYPNGTLYDCDFYGTFDHLEKVDDFTYKMKLSDISFQREPETEEIIDGVRYIYSDAYGLDGEDFYLYLPGSRVADLPQAFRDWVGYHDPDAVQEEELSFYGLYNVQGELGFSSSIYEEQSLSERIYMEISYAVEQEKEVEKKQEEAESQSEMNTAAGEMYQLWDDTLNAVWKLLEANLNEADMDALRKEEKEWIASKEAEVQAVGLEVEGGSLQPLVEATKAAELTKARVYELTKYVPGM